jgi:hypothetical protein
MILLIFILDKIDENDNGNDLDFCYHFFYILRKVIHGSGEFP